MREKEPGERMRTLSEGSSRASGRPELQHPDPEAPPLHRVTWLPWTLQKQNARPVPKTPEALLQVGGLRADQRGEFAVVLSTGKARSRGQSRGAVLYRLHLRRVGWPQPFWIEHLLKTHHGAQCRTRLTRDR